MTFMIIEDFMEVFGEFGMLEETLYELLGDCLGEHLRILSGIIGV